MRSDDGGGDDDDGDMTAATTAAVAAEGDSENVTECCDFDGDDDRAEFDKMWRGDGSGE